MAEFDPYLQWLGIRDPQRPPNHYRLLGLELFEANEAVIANAADRQMAHVRTFQSGQHGELSQKVLNELAAARVCLLKPDKKTAYDQQLRARTATARPAPAIPMPVPVGTAPMAARVAGAATVRPVASRPAQPAIESPFDEIANAAASTHSSARRKRKQQKSPAPYVLAAVVLLAIAIFGLVAFKANQTPQLASNPPISKEVESKGTEHRPDTPSDKPDNNEVKPEIKPATDPNVEPKAKPETKDDRKSPIHSPVIEDAKPTGNEVATNDTGPKNLPTELPDEKAETAVESKSTADKNPADVAEDVAKTETPVAEELPFIGPQPLDSKLVAIPSDDNRKAAVERIREIFGKDLDEARTVEAKQKLANTLIEQATATKSDTAAQFVLLDLAKELAVAASDVDLAHHAIDLQSEQFAVEPLASKYDALLQINRHARNADARTALIPAANQLVDATIERMDFSLALKLNKFVQQSATKARDREAMKSTLARDKAIKEMQRQQETAIAALEKIKTDPNDAKANFELGAYLCFVKQDWAKGLLRLSKSDHPLLQDAALQELAKPTEATKQKQLADLWLKCAQEKDLAVWSDGMQARARECYQQAIAGLTGLDKAEVEKRLGEIKKTDTAASGHKESTRQQVTISLPKGVPMIFRRIPPGSFLMGSPPTEIGRKEDETQHPVTISRAFYIGITEVTQPQWEAVMHNNPSEGARDPRFPVDSVSWNDAQAFTEAMTKAIGRGKSRFRLPTEAEWEYACRAGTQTAFFFGNDGSQLNRYCWNKTNSGLKSNPVGQLLPNNWGLFDLYGNVTEWCIDVYAPYAPNQQADPVNAAPSGDRVFRGANFQDGLSYFRSAHRIAGKLTPDLRRNYMGVRVVMEQD